MKLVYTVSQRTDIRRPAARHLDNVKESQCAAATGANLYLGGRRRGTNLQSLHRPRHDVTRRNVRAQQKQLT